MSRGKIRKFRILSVSCERELLRFEMCNAEVAFSLVTAASGGLGGGEGI